MKYYDLKFGDSMQPPYYPKCYRSFIFFNFDYDLDGNIRIRKGENPGERILVFYVMPSDGHMPIVKYGEIDKDGKLLFRVWRDDVLIWDPANEDV